MSRGFDYTEHLGRLCRDLVARLPELRHIDMDRVGVGFKQTRKNVSHGMFASLTPLRFRDGSMTTVRKGRDWTIQRVFDRSGRELLYILNVYLRRFQDVPWREKLITAVHELWHIGPNFDGDLRRHEGRCYAHGSSMSEFDAGATRLVDAWLAQDPPDEVHAFCRHDFRQLHGAHGGIFGHRWSRVKLLPVDNAVGRK